MQTIYIDIFNKNALPIVYAKQNDVGRKFLAVLTDSGVPYVPPNGSVFSVWYEGDSGEGNYTDIGDRSAFYVNGNKVTVELITQMLAIAGEGLLCLVLNGADGSQIASWNINYLIESIPGATSEQANAYYTAFSNAVANLPYPDESLSVQGKAADAAATGAALAEKAPAGYGLGGIAQRVNQITPGQMVDTLVNTGWYRLWNGDNGTPALEGWPFHEAEMFVEAFDNGIVCQTVYGVSYDHPVTAYIQGTRMRRWKTYGEWLPWEWVNPPMLLGVEYRTTERYEGKPVFIQRVNFGSLPVNSSKSIQVSATGVTDVVQYSGIYKDSDGSAGATLESDSNTQSNYNIHATTIGFTIVTKQDLSAYSAEITIKYVK